MHGAITKYSTVFGTFTHFDGYTRGWLKIIILREGVQLHYGKYVKTKFVIVSIAILDFVCLCPSIVVIFEVSFKSHVVTFLIRFT